MCIFKSRLTCFKLCLGCDRRARDHLGRLLGMKDNNIFRDLAALADPALELATTAALVKSFVQVQSMPCMLSSLTAGLHIIAAAIHSRFVMQFHWCGRGMLLLANADCIAMGNLPACNRPA